MASGPAAFYFSGSPDGSRPGVYFIRTTNLKGRSGGVKINYLLINEYICRFICSAEVFLLKLGSQVCMGVWFIMYADKDILVWHNK